MAGPILHEVFFYDCIQKSIINKKFDKWYINNCNIYAQGHDLLLYIETWNFIKNRNTSLILSNYKFKDFVWNYLQYAIKNTTIYIDTDVKLFLYGYISHHILDSFFHPFIMQYCEDYLPTKNKIWLHGLIETLYDSYFIKNRLNVNPSEYKVFNDLKMKSISTNLIKNIDMAVKNTYSINGTGIKFKKAFKSTHKHMRLYRYDLKGIKRKICKLADRFINLGVSNFFYDETELYKIENYKNNSHKKWHNVWINDNENFIYSTHSFDDIYNEALEITVGIINKIEYFIKTKKFDKQEILNYIPNRSAITGLECGRKLNFIKY